MFAVFDVMCSVNKDKSWMFTSPAWREDFPPDAYHFVLCGVDRIVGNFINAGSGNLLPRLVHLNLGSCHRSLLCEGSALKARQYYACQAVLAMRRNGLVRRMVLPLSPVTLARCDATQGFVRQPYRMRCISSPHLLSMVEVAPSSSGIGIYS
jgi:hypothetical protein